MDCAICHNPFLPGDDAPVPVVLAITGRGVLTGDAHPWCAKSLKAAAAPSNTPVS